MSIPYEYAIYKGSDKLKQKNQGIMYILIAAFFFALMTFFVRKSGNLPTMQKAFFRNAVAMVIALVMLGKNRQDFHIEKKSILSLVLRCVFGTSGLICNFYAIDRMNISDANMLNKLSPFFAIIMSAFILGEVAGAFDWGMVVLAFIGALFVVKPEFDSSVIPALLGVYGGFGAGTAYTFVRKLGGQGVKSDLIVFSFSAFSTIVTLPFVVVQYHHMELIQLIYLLLAGTSAAIAQFAITTAYSKAPAKEISVFDYSQVVFAALLGWAFLDQIPDMYSVIGYIIIIFSAVLKWRNGLDNKEN